MMSEEKKSEKSLTDFLVNLSPSRKLSSLFRSNNLWNSADVVVLFEPTLPSQE